MIEKIFMELVASKVIEAVVLLIVFDTIFGIIRAIKERSFNSSVGIDGAIRKVSMLVSLVGLQIADFITGFNLIGFIPQEIRAYLPLEVIGLAEFFGLIYCSYEIVSVLKNMALCGLPVKKLWEAVQKFLSKYTKELPCMDDMDEPEVDVEEIEEMEE